MIKNVSSVWRGRHATRMKPINEIQPYIFAQDLNTTNKPKK